MKFTKPALLLLFLFIALCEVFANHIVKVDSVTPVLEIGSKFQILEDENNSYTIHDVLHAKDSTYRI